LAARIFFFFAFAVRRRHRIAAKVPRGAVGRKMNVSSTKKREKKNGRCEGVFKQSRRCLGRRILRIILQVGCWQRKLAFENEIYEMLGDYSFIYMSFARF